MIPIRVYRDTFDKKACPPKLMHQSAMAQDDRRSHRDAALRGFNEVAHELQLTQTIRMALVCLNPPEPGQTRAKPGAILSFG